MNYTGYSVLEIPKTGAAFSYAKEARDFATGATGVGGYLNSAAVSNSWTDVRFISAIYEGSTSLPLSIGATLPDLYTGAATVIGGSTPIGDLRSEDGPYVGVGNSSVYYTKKGQEYGAAFYATYIGGTNSAPTKIGIGTTSTDISTSGYYEGSFTTREIYEFETSFTPDLDDLTKTITGSGVYKNGDSISLQFNILNRNGELLTSAAQIAADPFIDKQVISILDVDSNVVFPNYRDNGDSTFTFSRSQNIDVFGTYTRNFGVRNEIVNKNGLTSTGEFYLYGNTTTFDNILVQASGETVLNENLSNHSPPDTGSITSAADRADAIKYFNNQPVNTSGSTGFIELSLAFNEDPTFTEYSNLNIWASDTENFDSNIGNFLGSFPLDFSQEGQTIRLTPDNGIQDGTGLFFKLAVESSVEFEKEVFNLGPFTIEPIVEGPDLNLYNQGDQSMVGDFTIEGGLEGDSSNGGNLNVSGNALGTGIGGRLTGPESKMYLLSGDAGTESDTLQSVTFRGQSTDVGLSLIGSTPLSFDGTEGVPQTDKSIYYDNSDESLYFGHGIKTIKTDIAGGGPIGTTLRLFPSHSVTVGADGIIVGSSPATGSAILGGRSGTISGHYSTIAGGFSNKISGSNFGFIGGGSGIEVVDSVYAASIGGYDNDITGSNYSVIGGGQSNYIEGGNKNFIGGGSLNTISGSQAVVSAILGGENNLITGLNSVLLGGNSNEILSSYSFIGGGEENITSGLFSAISAGEGNKTFGLHSIIAGGQENTASGTYSFIGGGHLNTASANYSYAFGRRSKVGIYDTGAAVFSDGRDEDSISSGAHTATLDFSGGVYVPTSGMFGEGLFVSGVPVLTGVAEADTLQTVTNRGATSTNAISVSNVVTANQFNVGNEGKVISTSTLGLQLQANSTDKPIIFSTNSGGMTERMRITRTGVGIGVPDPVEMLELGAGGRIGLTDSAGTYDSVIYNDGTTFRVDDGAGSYHVDKINLLGLLDLGVGHAIKGIDNSIIANKDILAPKDGSFGFRTYGATNQYDAISSQFIDNNNNALSFNVKAGGTTSEAFRIDKDGNIGVDTTAPLAKLDVRGDISGSGSFLGTGVGNRITNNGVPYLLSGDSPAENDTLQDVTTRGNTTNTSIISTGPYISGVTGLFSGKVGIGVSDPSYPLEVAGNIFLQGDNRQIFFGGANTFVGESSNSQRLQLRGGGSTSSDTVIIDNDAKMGFGTIPSYGLHLKTNPDIFFEGNIAQNDYLFDGGGENLTVFRDPDNTNRTYLTFDKDDQLYVGRQGSVDLIVNGSNSLNTLIQTDASENDVFFPDGKYGFGFEGVEPSALVHVSGNSFFDGNVGIGTALASKELDVVGDIEVYNSHSAVNVGSSNNIATGNKSIAFGINNLADGSNSLAIGQNNDSHGNRSIAIGVGNDANVNDGVVVGQLNTVNADSVVIGRSNDVGAGADISIGQNNWVSGTQAVGVGVGNTVSGNYAQIFGRYNQGQFASVIYGGQNTSRSYNGVLFGLNNDSSGDSQAFGKYNYVTGTESTAIGRDNVIDENYSLAAGWENKVYGPRSAAVGYGNVISGNYSSAFGYYTVVGTNNTTEIGHYSSSREREGAVRIHDNHLVAISMRSGTAPTASTANDGFESETSLGSDMYTIQRNGSDYILYHNLGGSIETTTLGAAETQTLQDVCDNGNTTTTSIFSTGPYISGVTGYYKDTLRVGDGGFVDFPSEYDTLQVGTSSSATNGHILVRGKESSITFRGVEGSDKAHTIKEDAGTLTFYGDSTLSGTAGNARFAIQTGQSYFTDLVGVRGNGVKPQFYLASVGGGASNKATHFYQPANSADFRIALNGSQNNGTIGTDAFSIKSTYEVGVGTVDPRAALHVDNGAGATTGFLVENSSNKNILWAEDNESINARSTFNVYHTTVSSRYLKLGWGSIFANDNGNELTLGSNYSSNSATRIFVTAEGADNTPANTIQMQANHGLAVFSGVSTDTFEPTALIDVRGDAYISGSVEGTGAGNRITNNGVPYLLSGDSPAETQTLQDVCDNDNTTTTSIISTGPYISGVTGLFSDKVGIGVSDPTTKLEVSGAVLNSLAAFKEGSQGVEITTRGSNRQQIDFLGSNSSTINAKASLFINYDSDNGGSNDSIYFARNGADAAGTVDMIITEGDVGIGTTSPAAKLHVEDSSTSPIRAYNGSYYASIGANNNAAWVQAGGSPAHGLRLSAGANGAMSVYASRGVAIGEYPTTDPGADNFTVAGNVGIGVTSPNSTLHVEGVVSGSNSFLGTGVGNRITNNGVPYLLSGDSPAETQTLQDVCDNGDETTTSIFSTGPYISGVTGLFNKEFHVGDLGSNSHAFNFEKGNGAYDTNIVLKPFGNPGGFNSSYWMTVSKQAYSGFITNGNNSDFYIGHDLNKTALKLEYDGGGVSTFTTSNTDINFEDGTLFVDESAQRVGIGITSPSSKLDVYQTSSSASAITSRVPYKTNADSQLTQRAGLKIDINEGATSISIGGIGSSNGGFLQAYQTSSPSTDRPFVINPFGGKVGTNYGFNDGPDYDFDVNGTGRFVGDLYVQEVVSGSGSFLGTGDGNRITNNGVPYLLSGDSPAETQTLQDVTDNGNTTTNDIITSGDVEADEFIGDLRGAVSFSAKAAEALSAGEVVFISGIDGNTTVVAKADANDPTRMPAFGVSKETVNANANVRIVNFGPVSNINTSSYSEGEELFVSNTAGLLTGIAPTGESSALQKMAKVTRSHASAGSITVMGAGRTNAVPNLNEGNLFVGDSNNQAVADDTINVDIANSTVGISGVLSIPSGRAVASEDVYYIVKLTQAEYDAITPDSNTLYFITDEATNSPVVNPIRTVTGNYTITDTDYTVLVSGASSTNITLPSAVNNSNYVYNVKNLTTGDVILSGAVGLVDLSSSLNINSRFESVTVHSDGSNWYII